jgi:hypothetical protein
VVIAAKLGQFIQLQQRFNSCNTQPFHEEFDPHRNGQVIGPGNFTGNIPGVGDCKISIAGIGVLDVTRQLRLAPDKRSNQNFPVRQPLGGAIQASE